MKMRRKQEVKFTAILVIKWQLLKNKVSYKKYFFAILSLSKKLMIKFPVFDFNVPKVIKFCVLVIVRGVRHHYFLFLKFQLQLAF